MWLFETTLALLLAASLAVAFTPRLHLPLELVLLIGSLCVSLIPGIPKFDLESEAVFFILLPPILFAAAYFTSWNDFKRNLRPISLLAIGLVLFTVVGVGFGLNFLFPQIPLPIAFLLGAIVSPPDASAATAVARKLNLPRRVLTIIEGESLINDASALVCYRFAIAAILSGEFSLGAALGRFGIVAVGGTAIGILTGVASLWVMRRLKNSTAETLLSIVTSFASYLIAEKVGMSGVISTVAAGIYFGRKIPKHATPETRLEASGAWNVVLLALNGIVFAMIGLQLPHIIEELSGTDWSLTAKATATVTVLLIVLRFVWLIPSAYLSRLIPSVRRNDPMPPFSVLVVLSWLGMRGIVSLAAALAIPETLPSGAPFPYRAQIVFVTYVVILITLVLPTVTLPLIAKAFKLAAGDESEQEALKARIKMADSVLKTLDDLDRSNRYQPAHIEYIRKRYTAFRQRIAPNLNKEAAFSTLDLVEQHQRRLHQEVIEIERTSLHRLRHLGEIHDEVFHKLTNELDLEELRVRKFAHPL